MTSSIARNQRDMQDTILAALVAGAVMGTAGKRGLQLWHSASHTLRNNVHEPRLLNSLERAVKLGDMVVHDKQQVLQHYHTNLGYGQEGNLQDTLCAGVNWRKCRPNTCSGRIKWLHGSGSVSAEAHFVHNLAADLLC